MLAEIDNGAGPGVYRKDDFPTIPVHPNCLCMKVEFYGEAPPLTKYRTVKDYLKEQPEERRGKMIGARNAKHETLYRRGLSENGVNPEDRGKPRRVPAELVVPKKDLHSGEEIGILDRGGGVDKNRIFNMADTDGRRNERPLTPEQKNAVVDYAVSLGMSAERITFSETAITGYIGGDFDILRIGTDVLPLDKKSANPNDNISLKGVIAHEIVGHRGADLKGRSFQKYEDLHLDEAQASIRAARFAPGLSDKERRVLLRDGVMRLKNAGKTLREVRSLLHINER